MGVWTEKVLNLVYPTLPSCVGCFEKIEHGKICSSCLEDISFNKTKDKKSFENFEAYYAAYYSGSIKNILYNFKVHKDFKSGEFLGEILRDYIKDLGIKFDYLTYVPRDENKLKKEGFDQSYFLCKILNRSLNIPILKILSCRGKKFDQKQMNMYDRETNVKGKFFITKDISNLTGKNLLLIDDVSTTYSTLKEVSNVIRKTNDKTKLTILTIAKTLI